MKQFFVYGREGTTYRVGLIDPKQGNRFVEIANVAQQFWANQITLALNLREERLAAGDWLEAVAEQVPE